VRLKRQRDTACHFYYDIAMKPELPMKPARLAVATGRFDATASFSRAVFEAEFARGEDISDDAVWLPAWRMRDSIPMRFRRRSANPQVKASPLRMANCSEGTIVSDALRRAELRR
jgi:hypothetical protein